eukprot:5629170-Amphidinium_carterae.1
MQHITTSTVSPAADSRSRYICNAIWCQNGWNSNKKKNANNKSTHTVPVSYTHLTLPTILLV